MRWTYRYVCKSCGSTWTLIIDTARSSRNPSPADIPNAVVCGVGGCMEYKERVINEDF